MRYMAGTMSVFLKSFPLKKQRLASKFGEGIGEAVTEIEPLPRGGSCRSHGKPGVRDTPARLLPGSITMPMRRNSASHCWATSTPN